MLVHAARGASRHIKYCGWKVCLECELTNLAIHKGERKRAERAGGTPPVDTGIGEARALKPGVCAYPKRCSTMPTAALTPAEREAQGPVAPWATA